MKNILLVADEPGWVFERHCREIQKRLTEYNIDIAYHRQNINELSKNYDLVYILDPMPLAYPPAHKTIMGLRCEFLFRDHPQGARGLYENGFPGRCVSIKDKCCVFHVVNKHQMEVFKDIVTDKPLLLAQHGVDLNIFDRSKYIREPHSKLIASIAGRGSSNKGFEIVMSGCAKADVKCITAQYGGAKLAKEQMPAFYSRADVHICMSGNEGLNNPTMEAGAMGIPVISTYSGAASEMIIDGSSGFLISRSPEGLCGALMKMKDNNLRESMGEKFHEEIVKNWSWDVRVEDFRKMFQVFFKGRV